MRGFLINFIKTLPGGEDLAAFEAERQEDDVVQTRPHETSRPTNTRNAKAVRAYQSMANHSEERRDRAEKGAGKERIKEPTAAMLKSKELRDIHSLIDDLALLKKRGIEEIHIEKADTFLEAMKNAVKLLKSKI